MNRIAKFSLGILSLLGMLISALLAGLVYSFGSYSKFVERILKYEWFAYTILILAAILFLVSLIFFCISLAAKKKERALYIHTEAGRIKLTQNMIDQTILQAVKEKNVLRAPEVKTKLNDRNSSVEALIKGGVIPNESLQDAGKDLQQHVENQLKTLLQIDKVRVNIKVEEETKNGKIKKAARVV